MSLCLYVCVFACLCVCSLVGVFVFRSEFYCLLFVRCCLLCVVCPLWSERRVMIVFRCSLLFFG